MSSQSGRSLTAHHRSRGILLGSLLALAALGPACKPEVKPAAKPPAATEVKNELVEQLAGARIDQAKTKLDQKRPGEALALLVSALKADPASVEAATLAATILAETVWNFPALTIQHQLPVEQIAFAAPSSLWVSLGGNSNETARWNLETLQIESVLFPVERCITRSLVFDRLARSVVIERGPVTLLCNSQTLKPVCDLGPLPDFVTPSATVVFSPDGLLLAHPGFVSDADHSIVWHLRDAITGQIIRSSEPTASNAARPLAASLDREKLRVLHADGSLMEMPVSPVEPAKSIPMPEPVKLLSAQFSLDGNAALTLHEQGPHEPPVQSVISYQNEEDGSLELKPLVNRFPWSRQPNIWNGLMAAPEFAPYTVEGNSLKILTDPHAPVEVSGEISAVAFDSGKVITGETDGTLTVHHLLPPPLKIESATPPAAIRGVNETALENLCESLSGIRYDENGRTFGRIGADERFKDFNDCDFATIRVIFPTLDFNPVLADFKEIHPRAAGAESFQPLWNRMARADLTGKSWPDILKLSKGLENTPWYQQLTAAVLSKAPDHPVNLENSSWHASAQMEAIFQQNDGPVVLTAIKEAGGKGPAAAAALALALKSKHPEWIKASLESAVDLPPIVRQIALSRAAWLEGHKTTALSPWPEKFPEMKEVRQREDWEGWEQADFQPAMEAIRQCVKDELVAIEIPEDSTPEQRKAVADRLADPETIATVGKPRFALACMNAALAFSSHKEDSETTFQLANTARNLGAPPEPCMRAEALALTAMGDYEKAHPLWIELITEHPLETQIPGDYAEAAYTAFENADPQQAMTILTTGMHRYPQDGNFALRAGWVALLTGNSERGYQFLQAGKRIGFPEDKLENATALLTIAAAQSGSYDDATVYFNDLMRIDPAWAKLETLDTLDWPEELKTTLSQFMR
ncbi:MAG: tetratricopeptide repeat protein [Luteolibacter sp.]|uniref:tetratricopeptide repeat protein n=1 Tax=Luteolibacter sp. TaxID=1962973 RepID=UPI003263C51A